MKYRHSAVLVLICFVATGFFSSVSYSKGRSPSPNKKISDISWGRFVSWPAYVAQSGATEFYDEDLFKRVYADHIRRSHKDLLNIENIPWWAWEDWTLFFGAAASSDIIENIVPGPPCKNSRGQDTLGRETQLCLER